MSKLVICCDCEFLFHNHEGKETANNPTGENWYCSKKLRKSFSRLDYELRECDGFRLEYI
jgi:hypothetical protein